MTIDTQMQSNIVSLCNKKNKPVFFIIYYSFYFRICVLPCIPLNIKQLHVNKHLILFKIVYLSEQNPGTPKTLEAPNCPYERFRKKENGGKASPVRAGLGARGPSAASRPRGPAQLARDALSYVPPRPTASLHGGRRSNVPASTLLGTGG